MVAVFNGRQISKEAVVDLHRHYQGCLPFCPCFKHRFALVAYPANLFSPDIPACLGSRAMHGDQCKAPFVDMVCKPWVYKLEVQVQEWIDGTPLAHWSRTSRFLFLSLLFIPLYSMWNAHDVIQCYIYICIYIHLFEHRQTAHDILHTIHDVH